MTTPFEFQHPHTSERTYSNGRRVLHVELFKHDCAACVSALTEKAEEGRWLVRDLARQIQRDARAFFTTAEARRVLRWTAESFPWYGQVTVEGRAHPYTLDRRAYHRLLKSMVLHIESLAASWPRPAGRRLARGPKQSF